MPHRLSGRTIRTSLYLLALCSLLPAMGVILGYGWNEFQEESRRLRDQSLTLARAVADQQAQLTDSTRLLLATLSRLPDVRDHDTEALEPLFRQLIQDNPCYNNIFLLKPDGLMTASATSYPGPLNLLERRYSQEVLASRAFSAGEFAIGRTTASPVIHFASPVPAGGGDIGGIVVAAMRLSRYDELVSRIPLPPGSRVVLLDHKGIRLHRYPEHTAFSIGEPVSQRILDVMATAEQELAWEGADYFGAPAAYSFVHLRLRPDLPPYMTVMAIIPSLTVTGLLASGACPTIALLLATLLLALGIAGAVGRSIIGNGVQQLTRVAEELTAGNLTVRAGEVNGCMELRQLGSAFDRMAEDLASREELRKQAEDSLRESKELYQALIDSSQDAILLLDEDLVYLFASPAALRYTPWSLDQVQGKRLGELMPGLLTASQADRIKDVLRSGESLAVEEAVHIDGRQVWFDVRIVEVAGGHGRPRLLVSARDITERQLAEARLKTSLKEKEVLLREIHHRVKNNLQVVSSLLSLQSARLSEELARPLRDSLSRIRSMALVHQQIYQSNSLGAIDMAGYIRAHVSHMLRLYSVAGRSISLDVQGEDALLAIDQAVPCGLIINELVTNALKHAFPEGREGTVRISIDRKVDLVELAIADDGIGLPEDFSPGDSSGLGMQIVQSLVDQLAGRLEVHGREGAVFRLFFLAA